jgi:hypothetical protein
MVKRRSRYGQVMVKVWSSIGQVMVKHWSSHSQSLVKQWSSDGQSLVKHWSISGQAVVKECAIDQAVIKQTSTNGQTVITVKQQSTNCQAEVYNGHCQAAANQRVSSSKHWSSNSQQIVVKQMPNTKSDNDEPYFKQ